MARPDPTRVEPAKARAESRFFVETGQRPSQAALGQRRNERSSWDFAGRDVGRTERRGLWGRGKQSGRTLPEEMWVERAGGPDGDPGEPQGG